MASFLTLALELREEIYDNLLIEPAREFCPGTDTSDFFKYHFDPAILRVNRQIHHEAKDVIFKKNTYHYFFKQGSQHVMHFEHVQHPNTLPPIRVVDLHLRFNGIFDWKMDKARLRRRPEAVCNVLSQVQGLKELRLSIGGKPSMPSSTSHFPRHSIEGHDDRMRLNSEKMVILLSRFFDIVLSAFETLPDTIHLMPGHVDVEILGQRWIIAYPRLSHELFQDRLDKFMATRELAAGRKEEQQPKEEGLTISDLGASGSSTVSDEVKTEEEMQLVKKYRDLNSRTPLF